MSEPRQGATPRERVGEYELLQLLGHAHADRGGLIGARAPRDHRLDVGGRDDDLLVEDRVGVALQQAPCGDGLRPERAGRRPRPPGDIVEHAGVGRHEGAPGATFDGHVADRHPTLDAQGRDRLAREFERVAGGARRADPADERHDDVLGADARRQEAVHGDTHRLQAPVDERLRGEIMLDVGCADAEASAPKAP